MKRAFSLVELSIVLLIIGVIIVGIVEASSLVDKFRLSTAQSLTKSSPVASMTGLRVWFESTMEESFLESETFNGVEISQWKEINPQIYRRKILVQNPDKSLPSYVKSAMNNLPALLFEEAALVPEILSQDYNPTSMTVIAVIQALDNTGYNPILTIRDEGSATTGYILANEIDEDYTMWFGMSSGWDKNNYFPASDVLGKAFVIMATYDDNSKEGAIYKDGVLKASNVLSDYVPTQDIMFSVGAGIQVSGNYFNGYIGEIIIFDRALKDDEKVSITKYLKKKWRISA